MSMLKQALWATAAMTALAGCVELGDPECGDDGCDDEITVATESADPGDADDDQVPPLTPVSAWEEAARLEAEDGIARAVIGLATGPTIVPYAERDGVAVVGDDWEIGPVAELETARLRGAAYRDVWFPTGDIPFELESGFDADNATAVRNALSFLNQHTPLNLFESSAGRNLTFRPTEATSYGGMTYQYTVENDPRPLIRLSEIRKSGGVKVDATPNQIYGTTLHEMGHALGFAHEFQRPDRDDFVDVCFNVDWFNYAKLGSVYHLDRHAVLSPFDYESVMNGGYSSCVSGRGGVIADAVYNGRSQDLSVHDINSIYRVYADGLGTPADGDAFAHAVATGDFDDDGYQDVAVASTEPNGRLARTYVYFYRGVGVDASEHHAGHKHAPWFRQDVGASLPDARLTLAAGDFDGDGVTDLAIGDPDYSGGRGRVGVLTVSSMTRFYPDAPWGANTAEQLSWIRPSDVGISSTAAIEFGAALATGNLVSQSYDDLIIGVPGLPKPGRYTGTGAVVHLQGADDDRAVITYTPNLGTSGYGRSLTVMPDFCRQGLRGNFDTMVVGAPDRSSGRGAAHVYGCSRSLSGTRQAPALLTTSAQSQTGAHYGFSLAGFTVQRGKTWEHYLAAGAPDRVVSGERVGSVYLEQLFTSGSRSRVITYTPGTRYGNDDFGYALAVHQLGNTPNGVRIAIGLPGSEIPSGTDSGRVYLWKPWVDGELSRGSTFLYPMRPSSGMRYGSTIATLYDGQMFGGFAITSPAGRGITWQSSNGLTLPVLHDSGLLEVRHNKALLPMDWSSAKQLFDQGTRGDKPALN